MKQHYQMHITGRVQGVGFRAATQEQARTLGLSGYVQNRPDGSVYLEAVGPEEQLEQLRQWCQQGPAMARVEQVEVEKGAAPPNHQGFDIRP